VEGLTPRAKMLRLTTVNRRIVTLPPEMLSRAVVSAKNIMHQPVRQVIPQPIVDVRKQKVLNTVSGMNLYRNPFHAMAVAKVMC
jgi:hypothetical protein